MQCIVSVLSVLYSVLCIVSHPVLKLYCVILPYAVSSEKIEHRLNAALKHPY